MIPSHWVFTAHFRFLPVSSALVTSLLLYKITDKTNLWSDIGIYSNIHTPDLIFHLGDVLMSLCPFSCGLLPSLVGRYKGLWEGGSCEGMPVKKTNEWWLDQLCDFSGFQVLCILQEHGVSFEWLQSGRWYIEAVVLDTSSPVLKRVPLLSSPGGNCGC